MQQTFDAVVVGSGRRLGGEAAHRGGAPGGRAGGGEAAQPEAEGYTEHTLPHQMPLRGRRLAARDLQARQPVQTRCYQCDEYANHLFIDDAEHPYTTPADRRFDWIRGAARRRQVDPVGPPVVPPQRLRLQGGVARQLRGRLAAQLRGDGAVLRPGGALRRDQRAGRRAAAVARQPLPAAYGSHLRRGDSQEGDRGPRAWATTRPRRCSTAGSRRTM